MSFRIASVPLFYGAVFMVPLVLAAWAVRTLQVAVTPLQQVSVDSYAMMANTGWVQDY